MSAADAGRKKIEPRAVEFVAVGDHILNPNGREYLVKDFMPAPDRVWLTLQPVGQCGSKTVPMARGTEVRVRVRR